MDKGEWCLLANFSVKVGWRCPLTLQISPAGFLLMLADSKPRYARSWESKK